MGCFNVSCGISKITIKEGERAFLLPLERNCMTNEFSTSQFLYPNDIYNPFCFPIEGIYNDYGSLEKIKHNENTKILEKFLDISIEDFVGLLTDNRRDVLDEYSNFNKIFFKNKDILSDKYSFKEFLMELNFEEREEGYFYKNTGFVIIEEKNEWSINHKNKYGINPINYEELPYGNFYNLSKQKDLKDLKESFFKIFKMVSNITLGIIKEKTYEIVSNLSGMFIHGEVFDFMTKEDLINSKKDITFCKCDNFFLEYCGFKKDSENSMIGITYYIKDGITIELHSNDLFFVGDKRKKSYFYVEDFAKEWKRKTGETLPINKIKTNKYIWESIMKEIEEMKNTMFLIHGPEKYLNHVSLKYIEGFYSFRNYESFLKIYKEAFINGKLQKEYFQFKNLETNIYCTNTILFPTFQGLQGGCNEIEKNFYSKINEIILKRINEEE